MTPDPAWGCPLCGGRPYAVVARSWRFVVPMEPPSQNEIAKNTGAARHEYRRVRQAFEGAIWALAYQERVPKAEAPRRVTLTRLLGPRKRRYDPANLTGGCKPVVDALVNCGLLVDDGESWFEAYYRQERRGTGPGLEILIEELESNHGNGRRT